MKEFSTGLSNFFLCFQGNFLGEFFFEQIAVRSQTEHKTQKLYKLRNMFSFQSFVGPILKSVVPTAAI